MNARYSLPFPSYKKSRKREIESSEK